MERKEKLYTCIYYGVKNIQSNLNNIIITYNFNKNDINEYNYLPITNSVLWIFCHGLIFKKQTLIKCIDSLILKNNKINLDLTKLKRKNHVGFAFNVYNDIFITPNDMLNLIRCNNCDIIIDSCYSGYLSEFFIQKLLENKNRIFTCGINKELNIKYSGSELNYFLCKHKDIIYDNKKLQEEINKYNEKNKGFYLNLYY